MGQWESSGKSDEWYTPKYIFDSMGAYFDMDVAAPKNTNTFVPSYGFITKESLSVKWNGFVWMNPPFGGRNSLGPWMDKFFNHGNGVALTPDRTSAPWFIDSLNKAEYMLIGLKKVKFIDQEGVMGKHPANGTVLWGCGNKAKMALSNADKAGLGKIIFLKNDNYE